MTKCKGTDTLLTRITDIKDVVFVSRSGFSPEKTKEIANQIGQITQRLHQEKRSYILIGPGRWGTATPSLGIPVSWQQIWYFMFHVLCFIFVSFNI